MPAGIDRFDAAKINLFFGGPRAIPGVPVDRLLALGAEDYAGGQPGIFNMAVMGLRLAQRANGVSQLHGVVSREMFDGLWPGFDDLEVPISSITNGVHAPTWVDRSVYEVARKHLGTADIAGADLWHRIDEVPADAVWATKREMREKLVTEARRRVRSSWHKRGASEAELGWVDDVLSPDVLTIGFARRVPTYKRLTLMLRDPARLKRLLLHPERPGAAHHRRQVAPRRRDGQAPHPGDGRASPTTPRCATASSSCPTTTSPWRSTSTRAATSGSTTRSGPSRRAAPRA